MRSALPYIAPYFAFIAVGSLLASIPGIAPLAYPIKTVLTAGLLVYWARSYREIRLTFSPVAVGAGILVFVLWIGLTAYLPWSRFHPPAEGYNPVRESLASTLFFAGFRLAGAALVVPVFEELFVRSFAIRYLVKPDDFSSVPPGTFTWFSFWGSIALFCGGHKLWEMPAAFAAGVVYTLVLYRRRELADCIVAHATTNLLLGIYVLLTGTWGYW